MKRTPGGKRTSAKEQGPAAATGQEFALPVGSIAEAVERAERQSDSLVFALNSKSRVNENPFEAPNELLAALEWLANGLR